MPAKFVATCASQPFPASGENCLSVDFGTSEQRGIAERASEIEVSAMIPGESDSAVQMNSCTAQAFSVAAQTAPDSGAAKANRGESTCSAHSA